MEKNVTGKWIVFAYGLPDNATPGEPITGDAANITANIRIDGGAANAVDDTNPTELEDGYYIFDITAAESNGDNLLLTPVSSTADVQVIAVPGAVWTRPPNFNTLGIESDGDLTKVNTLDAHTAQTGDNYARLGAPAGASVSADIANVPTASEFNARTLAAADYFDPAADAVANVTLVATTTTVTNEVTANITKISGDTTAADNLESMYDGTGLVGDEYPAKQSQVTNIANVGAAVHKQFTGETLTTPATSTSGSYADTEQLDGVYLDFTSVSGGFDVELTTNIAGGIPESLEINGYIRGSNDAVRVQAYDYVASSFKTVGTWDGSSSTSNQTFVFTLFSHYVGTGANLGDIRIRLYNDNGAVDTALTSADIKIDQSFIAYAQGADGYDNGAVWFNSNASNTNTVINVDGTAGNPVSTSAALLTLMAATGLKNIEVTAGSTLTLGGAYEGYNINGNGSVLALGTQDVGGTVFSRFGSVSGVATTTGATTFYEDCIFTTATLPSYVAQQCGFGATVTQNGAGDYTHVDCYSTVAGSGSPTFARSGAGVVTGEYRRFSGGITQSGITGSDTFTIGGELGTVTLSGASGTVELRGIYKSVADSRSGSPTLNLDGAILGGDVADTLIDTGDIIDDIAALNDFDPTVDTVDVGALNGDTVSLLNFVDSALTITRGTATGTPTTTTMAASALTSHDDDHYIGLIVKWLTGALAGQGTDITDYDDATRTLTFTATTQAASAGDKFVIL